MCDEFTKEKVEVDGPDYEGLGLYLALNLDEEVLPREGIARYANKSTQQEKTEITGSGVSMMKQIDLDHR